MRALALSAALLALTVAQPASAQAPGALVAALTRGPCAQQLLAMDFAASAGQGFYCAAGRHYGSIQAVPGAAFSRASIGTAVDSAGRIINFGSGAPRITDQGLLVEQSRTNEVPFSSGATTWNLLAATVTANAGAAPDAATTATQIQEDATSNFHQVDRDVGPVAAATVYSFSFFAKVAGRNEIKFVYGVSGTNIIDSTIDLAAKTIIAGTTGVVFENYANGWVRVSLPNWTVASAGTLHLYIGLFNGGTNSYQGDGVSGVYIWGLQSEPGATISSLIPTGAAAVTRPADVLTLTYSPNGSSATAVYGAGSTASVTPTSPIDLGATGGGTWVGGYLRSLKVTR